jgi:hypothetical protein
MPQNQVLIFCEGEIEARLLNIILRTNNYRENFVIHAEGRALFPRTLLSSSADPPGVRGGTLGELRRQARDYNAAILVFDLDFGSPIQPAPNAARLSDFWLAPAVPSIESWLLTDRSVFDLISGDERYSINQTFDSYLTDNKFRFFNSRFLSALARKRVATIYNPNKAAMLSPSLRSFLKTLDHVRGRPVQEIDFTVPSSVLASLVREYYPPDLPIYRALDGSTYTGRDMVREIVEGSEIGRKYASDLLRVCRDLLARQAQKARAAG